MRLALNRIVEKRQHLHYWVFLFSVFPVRRNQSSEHSLSEPPPTTDTFKYFLLTKNLSVKQKMMVKAAELESWFKIPDKHCRIC